MITYLKQKLALLSISKPYTDIIGWYIDILMMYEVVKIKFNIFK